MGGPTAAVMSRTARFCSALIALIALVGLIGSVACAGGPGAAPLASSRGTDLRVAASADAAPLAAPSEAGSERRRAFPTKPPALPSDPRERRCAIATYDHQVRAPSAQDVPTPIARLPLGKCFASPKGAWALSIEIDDTMPSREGNVRGFVVVHVDANDTVTRRVTGMARSPDDEKKAAQDIAAWVHDNGSAAADVQTFDFDGDGDHELYIEWLTTIGSTREDAASWTDSVLLTFATGRIAPYAAAARISLWGLEDVDKDGRPDILTSSPYGGRQRRGQSPEYVWAPALVAHSLADGSFSTTDAVAAAAARQVCPKKPTTKELDAARRGDSIPPDADPWGRPSEETVRVVLAGCARLWGISAGAIRKAYAGPRELSPDIERVLGVEPPLTLK